MCFFVDYTTRRPLRSEQHTVLFTEEKEHSTMTVTIGTRTGQLTG